MRLSQETITHRRGVIAGGNRPSMNGPVPVLRGSSCQNALVLISESRSARPRSENTSHTHAQLWPSFHSRARSSHTHLLLIFASWELGTPSASLQRLASCVPVSFKRLLIQGLLIYIYIYYKIRYWPRDAMTLCLHHTNLAQKRTSSWSVQVKRLSTSWA